MSAVRAAIDGAADLRGAARNVLQLGAKWSAGALAPLLANALELAALQGRDAVFADAEDATSFAEDGFNVFSQTFREQIEFFRQKRIKPTQAWTDAMRGVHDRAFVIAGATDTGMLSDFQTAIAKAIETGDTLDNFRADFDGIVARYGWAYNGERGWRTRVIFETNIRTSYMAGRLKQMLDPDVVRMRPWWEYRHAETRVPENPRRLHVSWHGKVWRYDSAWWKTHFPPNDWFCSCGVWTLSDADLKRRGIKPEADGAPLMEPYRDPVSGALIEKPQGVGFGWDYMPGALWEQGLTPSALLKEGEELEHDPRIAVEIDTPEPIEDLLKSAKPFAAEMLEDGMAPADYVRAFLTPFGGDVGRAVLFADKAGDKVPVSDLLFRDATGDLKVMKRGRHRLVAMMAETLLDPDEIWMGVARKTGSDDLVVDRRYIRVDPKTAIQIVFEIGEKFWEAVTAYNPTKKKGDVDFKALDRRRGGKLLYKRPKQ